VFTGGATVNPRLDVLRGKYSNPQLAALDQISDARIWRLLFRRRRQATEQNSQKNQRIP